MKAYTITNGETQPFVTVQKHRLASGVEIPAVIVGEEGRGRRLGVVPVRLRPNSELRLGVDGQVKVTDVALSTTKSGRPKLIELDGHDGDRAVLVVFLTGIGFRGGNGHHGEFLGYEEKPRDFGGVVRTPKFAEFPGKIIAEGRIAQGDAGRMGNGDQLVAIMPPSCVFSTRRYGRLYGAPAIHVYEWNGEGNRLTAFTAESWLTYKDLGEL